MEGAPITKKNEGKNTTLESKEGFIPKVEFVFDIEKELDYINLFKNELKSSRLSVEDNFLLENDLPTFKKRIEDKYKEEDKKEIENNWKEIEEQYFKRIENVTGHKWLHQEYKVILVDSKFGLCNPFKPTTNEVAVSFNFSKREINYIIAHEIFHSHYFQIVDSKSEGKLFSTELNENCNILALLFSEVKNLFPFADDAFIKSCIKSHKKAEGYFPELLSIWENRKDFDDYLKNSLNIFKNNK